VSVEPPIGVDELVVEAVADAGREADVEDDGRSEGAIPVKASSCCLSTGSEVAVGLADESEE